MLVGRAKGSRLRMQRSGTTPARGEKELLCKSRLKCIDKLVHGDLLGGGNWGIGSVHHGFNPLGDGSGLVRPPQHQQGLAELGLQTGGHEVIGREDFRTLVGCALGVWQRLFDLTEASEAARQVATDEGGWQAGFTGQFDEHG